MADLFAGGIKPGSADVTVPVLLVSTANGAEVTGVAAGSVAATYWRQGGTPTAIAVSGLASVNAAHADGGWREVDAANLPGVYRLDVPDAAVATGADWVVVGVKATGAFAYVTCYALETARLASAAYTAPPSAASVADAVWDEATSGHATAGTTGKALSDAGAAGNPWEAATRTLTQSAAQVTAAVQGSALVIQRGDTFSATLTGLDVSGTPKLYWTVKRNAGDADSAAVLQVDTATGLLRLNGAAYATAGHGAIVINSATSITLTMDEAATASLLPQDGLVYDVQKVVGGAVTTLTQGAAYVTADVTRAIS